MANTLFPAMPSGLNLGSAPVVSYPFGTASSAYSPWGGYGPSAAFSSYGRPTPNLMAAKNVPMYQNTMVANNPCAYGNLHPDCVPPDTSMQQFGMSGANVANKLPQSRGMGLPQLMALVGNRGGQRPYGPDVAPFAPMPDMVSGLIQRGLMG